MLVNDTKVLGQQGSCRHLLGVTVCLASYSSALMMISEANTVDS